MKIIFKSKREVAITMSRKQYEAMCAALDSVTSYGNVVGPYRDVFRLYKAVIKEERKLKKGGTE